MSGSVLAVAAGPGLAIALVVVGLSIAAISRHSRLLAMVGLVSCGAVVPTAFVATDLAFAWASFGIRDVDPSHKSAMLADSISTAMYGGALSVGFVVLAGAAASFALYRTWSRPADLAAP